MGKHRKTRHTFQRTRRAVIVAALASSLLAGAKVPDQPHPSVSTSTSAIKLDAASYPDRPPIRLHPGTITMKAHVTVETRAAIMVKKYIGYPYVYGGSSPATGFDCSGLTQYVYRVLGKHLPRTAEEQFEYAKQIPEKDIGPGDLVFYHDTSDPRSYVYHVGMLVGTRYMVAAATESQGVVMQRWNWGGDTVTFGRI